MNDAKDLIEALIENQERLSAWESDFVQSLDERIDEVGLTQDQYDKLCQIFDKIMN